jgi:hypothetical protein
MGVVLCFRAMAGAQSTPTPRKTSRPRSSAHHGTVDVISTATEGTSFRVVLPLCHGLVSCPGVVQHHTDHVGKLRRIHGLRAPPGCASSDAWRGGAMGSLTVNVAPRPSPSLAAGTVPPLEFNEAAHDGQAETEPNLVGFASTRERQVRGAQLPRPRRAGTALADRRSVRPIGTPVRRGRTLRAEGAR